MIERYGDRYELQCDYCSNFEGDFLEFQEAVDFKKANNWKSEKSRRTMVRQMSRM